MYSELMEMKMALNLLRYYHAAGTVLTALHASSHLILKTSPSDVIIPILEMREPGFIVK